MHHVVCVCFNLGVLLCYLRGGEAFFETVSRDTVSHNLPGDILSSCLLILFHINIRLLKVWYCRKWDFHVCLDYKAGQLGKCGTNTVKVSKYSMYEYLESVPSVCHQDFCKVVMENTEGCACPGLWELTNQSRLGLSGRIVGVFWCGDCAKKQQALYSLNRTSSLFLHTNGMQCQSQRLFEGNVKHKTIPTLQTLPLLCVASA